MYGNFNAPGRNAIRTILAGLMRGSLIWLVALPLAFALVFGGLAVLVGVPPVEFALGFLSKSAIALYGPVGQVWAVGFFALAICFGVGRGLPALLQRRLLSAGLITRFTQTVGLGRGPCPALVRFALAMCAGACRPAVAAPH